MTTAFKSQMSNNIGKEMLGQNPVVIYGGKGAGLIRLRDARFNVPDFFVLPTSAFERFLSENESSIEKLSSDRNAREIIMHMRFSEELGRAIINEYERKFAGAMVAVRSSATVEDAEKKSNAGKFETVLSASRSELLDAVKIVYASLFNEETSGNPLMAVVVQKQIMPQKAGVSFVDSEKVVIDAVLGQGEILVSGRENGDVYVVDSSGVHRQIKLQKKESADGNVTEDVPLVAGAKQKLLDFEIIGVAEMSKKVLNAFGKPQDIEWCIDSNELFVLQSRPITKQIETPLLKNAGGLIPVSMGRAEGVPWFDMNKIPDSDAILVATYTEQRDLEKLVASGRIKGMITELGGVLSHEGIIARERGIPYLAGLKEPKKLLCNSKSVTLDTEKVSVLADGKDVVSAEAETYNWLNRDMEGLRTVQFSGRGKYGTVIRQIGDFAVLYSPIQTVEEVREAIAALGSTKKLSVVIDTDDKTLDMTNKNVVNIINNDSAINRYVRAMADAAMRFDVSAFKVAHESARALAVEQLREATDLYDTYKSAPSITTLENALKAFTKANSYYKGTCIMGQYFEFALGSYVSNNEGRIVTDIELYRLRSKYESTNLNIKHMEDSIQKTIENLDKTLPAFGSGSNSLEGLYNLLMPDAQKMLKEERLFALLFGIEK